MEYRDEIQSVSRLRTIRQMHSLTFTLLMPMACLLLIGWIISCVCASTRLVALAQPALKAVPVMSAAGEGNAERTEMTLSSASAETPAFSLAWSSTGFDRTSAIALGDYDSDGYLDLAV